MVPGISLQNSLKCASLSETSSFVYAAGGIHPNEINTDSIFTPDALVEILLHPRVVGVGETGMDLFHARVPAELQMEIFREHILLAETFGLTLIVHSRNAEREVLDILGESCLTVPVILHCYTGPADVALEAASRGYFIGFTGPLTFRKNDHLRDLAGSLPPEQLLIETDSPYLSPEPLRGRRNEPANVKYIAAVISEIWGLSQKKTAEILMENSLSALQLGQARRTDLVYRMYGNIYLNITGRCSNNCSFCIKNRADGIGGYYLKHHKEPEEKRLESIIETVSPRMGKELVFCGYGEPTMRPGCLQRLAGIASAEGFKVRLNTNGTCLTWLTAEETEDILESFNAVSISLNASSREEYNHICRPQDKDAWNRLMDFISLAQKSDAAISLTAVRTPDADLRSVTELADSLNLPLRIRG